MRLRRAAPLLVLALALPWAHPRAQQDAKPEFDVVSIKRNTSSAGFSSARMLTDGTQQLTNMSLPIESASPIPVLSRNIVGAPDWLRTERYDIVAKPPAGTPRDQLGAMWQTLFATRMKLVAHIEQRESSTFALVVARKDGKLGPELKRSTLDCGARVGAPSGPPPAPGQGAQDFTKQCGMMGNGTSIVTGGMTMDMFARNLQGRAGGPVENKTGLDGYYAFTLTFAPVGRGGVAPDAGSDAPDFFTAVLDQLGLKLESSKAQVPFFVIDHIERPTED